VDFDGLVVWIKLLDGEVGQVQLVRIGDAPADGGLNMFDCCFLQNLIGIRAAMSTIRIDRGPVQCAPSGWAALRPAVGCRAGIGSQLDFGDQLQGFYGSQVSLTIGNIALVAFTLFFPIVASSHPETAGWWRSRPVGVGPPHRCSSWKCSPKTRPSTWYRPARPA